MRLFQLVSFGFALALLGGCALPRVDVPSSSSMLGTRPEETKIAIKGYNVSGEVKPHEVKTDIRIAGTSRVINFPKQAREYLVKDLENYIQARFRISADSGVILRVNLEQAYNYTTSKSSGLNVVPFVNVVASFADGFQQVPTTFIVEVELEVKGESINSEKVSAFITRTDSVGNQWSASIDKQREIYKTQLASVRKELFDQLDDQLLSLWKEGVYVGKTAKSPKREAAILASEIARLDSALADGKISKSEHADLVKSVKNRFEN
jgi:hypothetical protein